MSYKINTTSKSETISIPDAQLITAYGGLNLVGKKYPGFGTSLITDLVHITENFANSVPPINPFVGQLWYNTITNTLNFWNGTSFIDINIITSSPTAPQNPQGSDQWFNTTTGQLFIWDNSQWLLIGPQGVSGGGLEGLIVNSIIVGANTIYYLELYANNQLLGIISSQEMIHPEINGFGNIRPGLNFVVSPTLGIPLSGIYNIEELTIGNNDQIHTTIDSNDNMLLSLNENTTGGNVLLASTNSGNPSEVSSLTGNVYIHNLIATGNISGNLGIGGSDGQILFNNHGGFGSTPNLTISSDRSNISISHTLFVSNITANNEVIAGNLNVNGNVNVNGSVIFNSGGSNAFVLPNTKGTNGNILTSNGDGTTSWSPFNIIRTDKTGIYADYSIYTNGASAVYEEVTLNCTSSTGPNPYSILSAYINGTNGPSSTSSNIFPSTVSIGFWVPANGNFSVIYTGYGGGSFVGSLSWTEVSFI